jgi:hypothetical protein
LPPFHRPTVRVSPESDALGSITPKKKQDEMSKFTQEHLKRRHRRGKGPYAANFFEKKDKKLRPVQTNPSDRDTA